MSTFPGNFSCKLFYFQYRHFFIAWMKKNNAVCCMQNRAYGSVPVRYIPKKSNKVEESKSLRSSKKEENDDCVRIRVSDAEQSYRRTSVWDEKNQIQNRRALNNLISDSESDAEQSQHNSLWDEKNQIQNKRCVNNLIFDAESDAEQSYLRTSVWDEKNQIQNKRPMNDLICEVESESEEAYDCDVSAVDFEFMQEPEDVVKEFKICQEKDYSQLDVSQVSKSKEDAEKLAIELLATRAYTAVELKKKLLGRRVAHDIAEAVINDFQSRGLINDILYAETYSRSRWSSSSWGPRRIKQALFKKGVCEADVEKAVKLVFEDDGSGGDPEPRHGLSKLSMDHLFVQASKQWLRGGDVPRETRKSRIIRWLQYRGFTWGVVSFILKKLESQYPH